MGVVRDKKTGRALEAKTIIEARMTAIKPDEFKRGDMYGHDHELSEVMHYELHFDGNEKFYFDFWTNAKRINGTDHNADTNRSPAHRLIDRPQDPIGTGCAPAAPLPAR